MFVIQDQNTDGSYIYNNKDVMPKKNYRNRRQLYIMPESTLRKS